MSSGTAIAADACYNCGAALSGKFCAACGQQVQPLDPSIGHFLHDLSHELLSFDGKIFQSIWTLLAKPGVLTRDYFAGRRVRWVSPIRLYLVFSAAYIAFGSRDSGTSERVFQAVGYLMIVLVPLYAWLVSLFAAMRKRYPQHLYFALHVHAAWFAGFLTNELVRAVLSFFMASTRFVGRLMLAYVIAYPVLAFRTAYGERWFRAVMKTAVVMSAYLAVVSASFLALAAS